MPPGAIHAVAPLLALLLCLAADAQPLPPDDAPERVRADSLATIVDVAELDVAVTRFLAFRAPAEGNLSSRLLFLQPVEGPPGDVRAQIMTSGAFEQTYLATNTTELGFYRRALSERKLRLCLFTEIGMNGGLPAWPILWRSWRLDAPAITAVANWRRTTAPRDLHAVADLQVAPYSAVGDLPARLRGPLREAAGRLRQPYVIIVSVAPALSFGANAEDEAVAGLRLSYNFPLQEDASPERIIVPPLVGSYAERVPLVRTYAVAPPATRLVGLGTAGPDSDTPQQLVNSALESMRSRSGKVLPSESVVTKTHSLEDHAVLRRVATRADAREEISLTLRRGGIGALGALRRAVGEVILATLWPITFLLYLFGVWWAAKGQSWLTGARDAKEPIRGLALCAVLFPVLTPWLMLRYARTASLPREGESGDALSVLPPVEYEALTRLLVWALLIAVNWAALESVARLGMWLRFG
jgi:hypothetical protein